MGPMAASASDVSRLQEAPARIDSILTLESVPARTVVRLISFLDDDWDYAAYRKWRARERRCMSAGATACCLLTVRSPPSSLDAPTMTMMRMTMPAMMSRRIFMSCVRGLIETVSPGARLPGAHTAEAPHAPSTTLPSAPGSPRA